MKNKLSLALAVLALVVFLFFLRGFPWRESVRHYLTILQESGPRAPIVFIGSYVLACLFFLPGFLLTLGAGAVFGLAKGILLVSLGSTMGAGAAFLTGRYLARDWVAGQIARNQRLIRLDQLVQLNGWKIVLLVRLSPLFPFNFVNYAFGTTKVIFWQYVLASWLGMLPATVFYVYAGVVAGDIVSPRLQSEAILTGRNILLIAGFVATLGVAYVAAQMARRSLGIRSIDKN